MYSTSFRLKNVLNYVCFYDYEQNPTWQEFHSLSTSSAITRENHPRGTIVIISPYHLGEKDIEWVLRHASESCGLQVRTTEKLNT